MSETRRQMDRDLAALRVELMDRFTAHEATSAESLRAGLTEVREDWSKDLDELKSELTGQMSELLRKVEGIAQRQDATDRDRRDAEMIAKGRALERQQQGQEPPPVGERPPAPEPPPADSPVAEGLGKVLTAVAENIRVIVGLVSLALAAAGVGGPVAYELGHSMLADEAKALERRASAADTGIDPVGEP